MFPFLPVPGDWGFGESNVCFLVSTSATSSALLHTSNAFLTSPDSADILADRKLIAAGLIISSSDLDMESSLDVIILLISFFE